MSGFVAAVQSLVLQKCIPCPRQLVKIYFMTKFSHAQTPTCRFFSMGQRHLAEAYAEDKPDNTEDTPKKNLRPVVDVDTSIKYMQSKAYQLTYGDVPVWEPYRRNHKGARPPVKTRKTCIRSGVIATGNPCPICRDEYLVVHPKNTELLKQFISLQSGEVITFEKTGVCQKQHKKLLVAVQQAWDMGTLDMPVPFRKYDYTQYFTTNQTEQQQ